MNDGPRPRRSLRGMGLRARLILLGTGGLAVGLALGGVVLVAVLQATLERAVDAAGVQTARDVAALTDAGLLPDPIPSGGTTVVQVVGAGGEVRAASAGADRLVAVLRPDELAEARNGTLDYLPGFRFGVEGVVRVVVLDAGPDSDRQTVVVASPAGDIGESVRVVRTALLVGYGVLLVILAALAWRIVGATLRPVEALRRGAEEITGTGTAGSLPVPASRDEIHALAVTLNGMLARLDAARDRQRAFVADAAHELRSPLASLRTQLEVGGGEPADLLAEVQRMTRLVDDLLLLARLDEAPPARCVPIDLTELAREVASRYAGARVPVDTVDAACPPVWADSGALRRVLGNLLDNAVRYAGSRVTVAVTTVGPESVLLTVTDDGPGVPPADRDRVFDRFTRLADSRDRDTGGSGLGLAIVRELVADHGGTVTLTDAVPTGLRVEVRLPVGDLAPLEGAAVNRC